MKKLRVGVIYGGRSGEHEVSLASAAAVFKNLDASRYDAVAIRIEKDGRWTLPKRPPTLITRSLEEAQAFHAEHGEVVVKPLHGNAGAAVFHVGSKDANLAALTELSGRIWRERARGNASQPG